MLVYFYFSWNILKMKTQIVNVIRFATLYGIVILSGACTQPAVESEDSTETLSNVFLGIAEYAEAKAADGDADAQYGAGAAYKNFDDSKAAFWFRKAAEQGHSNSQYYLGNAYWLGKGVPRELNEAKKWLQKAAEQGVGQAQFELGVLYTQDDKQKSAYWFRKAEEQHIIFWRDKREGVRWFRERAERGDADAQFNLCYAYEDGMGVAEDQHESARWCRKAAEQGHAGAQLGLGVSYYSGSGVIQDKYEAYIWFAISKAYGGGYVDSFIFDIEENKLLSRAEIRSAKKEAARRMEAIEQNRKGRSRSFSSGVNFATVPKGPDAATSVFENTWRSVVVITNNQSQGSGVIIRPNIVATNCHLVNGGGSITIYKSANRKVDTNTPFFASIRYADEGKDFCLLDVGGLWGVPATVRNYDSLKVGESVYGLGAPQGLDLSISLGLISQLRIHKGNRYVQTDAAISPGSSGGGLFDSAGNLVGILTAKITDEGVEGIGFAIPADLASGL